MHSQEDSGNTLTAEGGAAIHQKLKVSKNDQKQSSLDKPYNFEWSAKEDILRN